MIYHFEDLHLITISISQDSVMPKFHSINVKRLPCCLFKWKNQSHLKKFHNCRDWNHSKFMVSNLSYQESLTVFVSHLCLILSRRYFRYFPLSSNPDPYSLPYSLPLENLAEKEKDCPQYSNSHKTNTVGVCIHVHPFLLLFLQWNNVQGCVFYLILFPNLCSGFCLLPLTQEL